MRAILRRIFQGAITLLVTFLICGGLLWWYISMWDQAADPDFDATVTAPEFEVGGPRVLFDQAHFNAHSLRTTYAPFAALLGNDGYRVVENAEPFGAAILDDIQVLVIVNARGTDETGRRGEPAFTKREIDTVYEWVQSGGSLLLVADHAPFGSAAGALAEKFEVDMGNVDTVDPEHHDPLTGSVGFLLFSEENGLLASHPIIAGRHERERISRVLTFNGQSLEGPEDSMPVLVFSEGAVDRFPDGSEVSVRGRVQALTIEVGSGRVVVLGEAAILTAQIGRVPFQDPIVAGMNRTDVDNKQFVLNVMHWLSGVVG